jgi:DNA-binding NtrC family response regulator
MIAQERKHGRHRLPVAVVVEDDDHQRDLLGAIFEESDVQVIACDSADAAMKVMEKVGARTVFMFADISDGAGLESAVERRWPQTRLLTTGPKQIRASGARAKRTKRIEKPWRALELIVELERAIAAR